MSFFSDLKQRTTEWLAGGEDESYEASKADIFDPPFEGISDYLSYAAFEPKTGLFMLDAPLKKSENLGAGFIIEVNPLLGADDATMKRLSTMFSVLPEHAGLQIQMFGSPDIVSFLKNYDAVQESRSVDDPRRVVFEQLAKKRTDFWKTGASDIMFPGTTVRLRNFRCLVAVTIPDVNFEVRSQIEQVTKLRERMVSTLKASHMFHSVWGAQDLLDWCVLLLNPHRMFSDLSLESSPVWNEYMFLRDQIIEQRTCFKVLDSGNGIRFGTPENNDCVIARCYSVKDYPPIFHLSGMGAMIGDAIQANLNYSSPFLISMNLVKPNYDEKLNSTRLQNARATQVADTPIARIMPEVSKRKADLDILLASYEDGGGGAVSIFHQIILWDKPDKIEAAESQAEAVWKTRGFSLYRDQFLQISSLLTVLPMSLDKYIQKTIKMKKRWSTKTMQNAVALSPVIGEWKGMGEPIIGLFGTRGQCFGMDLFANTAGGYNAAVVGGTGSGKSFFVNEIVRNYLGANAQAWIIDVGRSYEKFCQVIGGQYIEFSETSNMVIAPFELVTNIFEDIQLLKLVFGLMCSPKAELDAYQSAKLEEVILNVWNRLGKTASIDDLRDDLLKVTIGETGEPDREINRLGDQLFPYTSQGVYGRYFNGKTTLDFNDDLVVLELEELKSKPDLQQVIMQLIIYRIMQEMYLKRDRKKLVVIDEAWALLGGSASVAQFIAEGYRRVRKYNGAFITATQSLKDYYSNEAANAALTNSDFFFHLRAKEDSIRTLEDKKPFDVNAGVVERLRALDKTENYSEVYIHTPMGSGVGRLISDPFNALISSSRAQDFEAVNYYKNQGMNIADAVNSVLIDRQQGSM